MAIQFVFHLAGGSYGEIRIVCGVSKASYLACVSKFFDAVLACPELQIKFPLTAEEKKSTAAEFQRISSYGVHRGVCKRSASNRFCSRASVLSKVELHHESRTQRPFQLQFNGIALESTYNPCIIVFHRCD
jgi:hypothetical protein